MVGDAFFLLPIDALESSHGAIPPRLGVRGFAKPFIVTLVCTVCYRVRFVRLSPQDNITCEISSDYIALWPTGLVSITSLDVAAVSEAVAAVLEHALLLEPCQPSWLRTQADIYYGKRASAVCHQVIQSQSFVHRCCTIG